MKKSCLARRETERESPMNKLFSTLVLSAAALAVSGTMAAQAAPDIPCSTARLIVPWKAGGGTHVIFSIFEKTIQNLDVTPKIKVVNSRSGGQQGRQGSSQGKSRWLHPVRHPSERHHQLSERPHQIPF